jgi:hypothetical protein
MVVVKEVAEQPGGMRKFRVAQTGWFHERLLLQMHGGEKKSSENAKARPENGGFRIWPWKARLFAPETT